MNCYYYHFCYYYSYYSYCLCATQLQILECVCCRPSYPWLAAELISEVAVCTKFKDSKTYLTALLKVLLALPLTGSDPAAIKQLRALVGKLFVARCKKLAADRPIQLIVTFENEAIHCDRTEGAFGFLSA